MSHLIAASYKDSSIEADMNWLNGDSLAIVIAGRYDLFEKHQRWM